MLPSRRTLLVALLALGLALAACSGGDPLLSEDDRNLAARMSDRLPLGSPTVPVTADESNCLSKKVVSTIGSDRLAADYGISRETIAEGRNPWEVAFSSADAQVLGDATFDCIDWERFMTDTFLQAGSQPAAAACMAAAIDLGLLRDQAVAGYQGIDASDALEASIDEDFAAARTSCS